MAPRPRIDCPGCGRKMAKGSRLCKSCRRRAIGIGVEAVERTPGAKRLDSLTPGQRRAFYGKVNALDELYREEQGVWHDHALVQASKQFGRSITSVNELSDPEAGWVLDMLTAELKAARLAIGVA